MNRASAGGEESLPPPPTSLLVFSLPARALYPTRPKQEGQGGLKLSIQGLMKRVIGFLQHPPDQPMPTGGEQSWAPFPFVEEVGKKQQQKRLHLCCLCTRTICLISHCH